MNITRKEHGNAAYLAAWRAANPDKDKAYQQKYRDSNRAKTRVAVRKCQKKRVASATVMLNAYKVTKGCVDCGYNAHPEALDFDHVPGHKKVANLSALRSHSWERIRVELEKCEVVCANCHRVRTAARRSQRTTTSHPRDVQP